MEKYNPKTIEPKWQSVWAQTKLYAAKDFDETKPKYYMLTEFPYPSGDGLHLGHVREYTLGDILARYKRMGGYNVLYPMGYDSFGLPAENYAIKNKIAPQTAIEQNIAAFRKQFDSMGYSIDWDRSFSTTEPDYYKWTQWLFLQFFKAGLAYQDEIAINWCPKCKTGLANEEVVSGRHERCGTLVEKKLLKQWLLGITQYADRLIEGLKDVDYPSRIADQQVNWIGRSVGAEVDFAIEGYSDKLTIFTTRIDTIYGATYMVLAPEHSLVEKITTADQKSKVESYVKKAQGESEVERMNTERAKTGVFTGAYAINPANGEKIPIWVADYVLMGYGSGAIMAVPAHDQRDFEFAKAFELPICQVVRPITGGGKPRADAEVRHTVSAVVHRPSDGKFLLVRWPKLGWLAPVVGGIDYGETAEKAAEREVFEEIGYHVEAIRLLGGQTESHFFAENKNVWRYRIDQPVLLELVADNQESPSGEERAKVQPVWLSAETAVAEMTHKDNNIALQRYLGQVAEIETGEGIMMNSDKYDGMSSSEARENMTKALGREKINYKLRDWIFSRQHYWGEPIPIVHCPEHGAVPVPEDQLPVKLPEVDNYEPTGTGDSPLAVIDNWVNTTCPICGKTAKRETDTMPNWAGSSWYYLRYMDAQNSKVFADRSKMEYWGAVDMYLGGMEHTTLHLLYSRFWHQFLYDRGLVPTPEPYAARRGQGIILAEDNTKMSKSKGNVTNPSSIIEQGYGADALRLAISFLAPFDQTTPWNPNGLDGTKRFLNRVWMLVQEHLSTFNVQRSTFNVAAGTDKALEAALGAATHRTLKKVTLDVEHFNFNTAIAAQMELVNEMYKLKVRLPLANPAWRESLMILLQMAAPFAPHIAEELWQQLGQEKSIHVSGWPVFDRELIKDELATIVLQINGKVRAQLQAETGASEADVVAAAKAHEAFERSTKGKQIVKTIYVSDKLVNFVVK